MLVVGLLGRFRGGGLSLGRGCSRAHLWWVSCLVTREEREWAQRGESRRTGVTILAFVRSHALWDRLLGLAIFESAKVEGPVSGSPQSVTNI